MDLISYFRFYSVFTLILLLLGEKPVCATSLQESRLNIGLGRSLHIGVQSPDPEIAVKGDILYLHGYGDRIDNHGPLFDQWNKAGFRVIAFDFPSHGQTQAGPLDLYGIGDLGRLALKVEAATRENRDRPLFLAGWSTGGLVAVRMVQSFLYEKSTRKPSGLVLFAPGVSVYKFVGGDGIIRERTLTNNSHPPHHGAIKPVSPFLTPIFATKLIFNTILANADSLPSDLPVLTFVADAKQDLYAKSPKLIKWVKKQRKSKRAQIYAFSCPGSKHEMDNEPFPVGAFVRQNAVNFFSKILKGSEEEISLASNSTCHAF